MKNKKTAGDSAGSRTHEESAGSRRRLLNGSYSLAITAVVIALVVVINFIIGAIPGKYTTFDVSAQKLYSIGDTTKTLLDGLDEDVTLYYLVQSGNEDTTVQRLLDTYDGYSGHVKVENVDIVANPTFAKQYTDDDVQANSVLAVCGDRSKLISADDLYKYDYSGYSYNVSGFDGEGQITSAINYVTSDSLAKIYYTTGHNEVTFDDTMNSLLEKANVETEEINLLSTDIPSDCTSLVIFSPMSDFTEEEAQKVKSYLADGGHAMIVSFCAVPTDETPNFDSIMAAYGVTREDGMIQEGDPSGYTMYPYLLLPTVNTSSEVTQGLDSENLVYAAASPVNVDDEGDSTYAVTSLLTTSASAYLKDINNLTTLEKEDGDEEGPFTVAVSVEATPSNDSDGQPDVDLENGNAAGTTADSTAADSGTTENSSSSGNSTDSSKATKIVYFTTPGVFSMSALSSMLQQQVSGLPSGNATLFSNTISYLTDEETPVSIEAKSTETQYNTVSSAQASVIGNVVMLVIPAAVIVAGVVVFVRRRRH